MAMVVCDALNSIGGKVVELLVEPVGRQFDYVFYRVKYIEDLREQVQNLEAQSKDVLDSIDAAKRNREEILESVKNWIDKVNGFILEAKEFLEGGTNVNQKCFNGWFPDLVTRRRLGKAAKNKSEEAKELGKEGTFNNNISKPAPPLGIESIPSEQLVPYASRDLAMTNVMEALSDDNINFIGLHGIGGVGKTTLVTEIGKKAKSNKLFDDAVMAIVSQNPDIKKIQGQIASCLDFNELNNKENEIERASMLWAKLKDVKKILVILDDVWAKLNLAAVGIPFGNDHQGCKIIITTRREQVCNSMGMERLRKKIVHLGVLSEKDSWDLFKKNVGDVVNSNELNIVANEVCKECGGLPIALVTVGSAMKGKDDPNLWNEAARELRKSMPTNIEGVDQQVYKSLRLSYDYLHDEEAKACFLLCSLFPEDHNILIEDLVRYGMGLRVFKNVDTVQEARGRAKSVINNLIASCLLLASDNKEDCIKMHEVVRDVAIAIGSKKYFVRAGSNLNDWPKINSLDQYTGISLMRNQISNLPEVLECPKLQILLLQYNREAWSCSHEFFSRMNALSVLDLSYDFDNPIRSPDAFNNQTCLRTLVLDGIKFGDTKFLGQLKTLEVLSLRHAFFFEAPNAIGELTNLRLLDMTKSCHEFPIPATMVLPLFHLEELYLFGITSSSIGYPAVEVVAALRSWPRLKVLTISIPDIAYIPKDFVFPEMESFIIFIGKSSSEASVEDYSPNYLNLANLVGSMVNWSKWLKMVLNRATHLRIEGCSQFKYLIDTEEWGISSQAQPHDLQLLFNLEELKLSRLDTFEGICAASALTSSGWVCFPKLRILTVRECPELSTVILPFNLLQRLQHLEKLWVGDCKKLEQVFDFGSEGEGMKLLSSLRDLYLFKLPRLKHILNCSSRQHVEFCNLRSMIVESCGKLKYVFQPSIAQALHQLEELWVYKCEEMEEIVAVKQNEGQQEEEERVDYKMVFKSLVYLRLEGLPNLSGFCTGGDDFPFEWPSLEYLHVKKCPKMKTFAATTSASTPKLKQVRLDESVIPLRGMDLNQFVQTHITSKQFVPYNLAMTNVMEALSDDNINFIGIHGIGGVGKTTLVKEIAKKAKSDKLFDEVVMVVVSQNPNIKTIQDEIAGMLGFTSLINQPSATARTSMLCARLRAVKKILVILDNVWAKLDLAVVGIPFGNDHQGCKIIITTRLEQVCNSMGMERLRTKIVHLGVLSEQDSWDLFRKNVGDVVASSALNDVAREVCKECGGLPIAVVTVAKAMKGKSNLEEWKNAAQELKKSLPTNIEDVNKKVYQILMWSYDYLQDEEAKACFLLCSLFPEDDDILVEDLVRYGMGLRLFKNVDTVQEVRGRAKSVISNLIDSCLLLASDKQDRIKMHDVVRDVAIFIGSKKHFVRAGCNLKDWPNMDSLDQYTGISLMKNQISNLPEVLERPKLQILLLQENENAWSCSHEFFSRMNALSVLDLSQRLDYDFDNPIRSPDAFNNQTCLRTLVLDGIKFGDTKFLGQLKTLEVLSLRHAFFSEAPNAISELTNLRLLDMTESRHEFLIPIAMVSPLSHLEELYLLGTKYSRRIGDPAVEVAAALRSWPRLKVLTISIPDIAYVPKDSVFSELESFIIFIGKSSFQGRVENYSPNYLEVVNLVGPMVNWSKWLKMVLKRATHLRIEDCSELEYLINIEEWGISSQAQPSDLQLLFNLKELELSSLDTFKGICAAGELTTTSWACFPKLRSLEVNNCPSLSTVLLPFNLLQRLQHLEKLSVTGCVKLELVFDFGSEGEGMKLLSSLTELTLVRLPRLKHILNCSSRQEERVDYKMVFKSLKRLYLQDLPNLSGFCTGGDYPKTEPS